MNGSDLPDFANARKTVFFSFVKWKKLSHFEKLEHEKAVDVLKEWIQFADFKKNIHPVFVTILVDIGVVPIAM